MNNLYNRLVSHLLCPYELFKCSLPPVSQHAYRKQMCMNIFALRTHRALYDLNISCGPPA